MSKKELKNGWAFEPSDGGIYHFKHLPISEANRMAKKRESVFIIETINWTFGKNDKEVHQNEYFALSLPAAIALAARIEIEAQDVAEEVVSIRQATAEEAHRFLKVFDHFQEYSAPALSEEEAGAMR